ncbi:hypothetical protein D3C73_1623670 [compost metagenome]
MDNHQIELCSKLEELEYISFYLPKNSDENTDNEIVGFDEKIKELRNKNLKEYIADTNYLKILEAEI